MNRTHISLSVELISEFKAWGQITTHLFGKLRSKVKLQTKTQTFVPVIPDLKHPKHIPKAQAWFWHTDWLTSEQTVNNELAKGKFIAFKTAEAAIRFLHQAEFV